MADILQSAQKLIDDAANQAKLPADSSSAPASVVMPSDINQQTTNQTSVTNQTATPLTPANQGIGPLKPNNSFMSTEVLTDAISNPEKPDHDNPQPNNPLVGIVDQINQVQTVDSIKQTSVSPPKDNQIIDSGNVPPQPSKPKKSKVGFVLTAFLLLAVTLPLSVIYVSQQKQLADNRGKAAESCSCDGFAKCEEVHDNTENCRKYLCTRDGWQDIGEATHPECGGTQDKGVCGDEVCAGGETKKSCPQDCAKIPPPKTKPTPGRGTADSCNWCGRDGQGACDASCHGKNDVLSCDTGFHLEGSSCVVTKAKPTIKPDTICPNQGVLGKPCRAPQNCNNLPNCEEGLICQSGTCQKPQTGQCGNGNCLVCSCPKCADYGGGLNECRSDSPGANCQTVPCAQAVLNGCGQIDFLDKTGAYCQVKQQACTGSCAGGGKTIPPPSPSEPPEPTNESIAQCKDIKIYKDGERVKPDTLEAGDKVEIAVVGENAKKARLRVNGAKFTETAKKNAKGEFILAFTVPQGVYKFTIEAEVFRKGKWQ